MIMISYFGDLTGAYTLGRASTAAISSQQSCRKHERRQVIYCAILLRQPSRYGFLGVGTELEVLRRMLRTSRVLFSCTRACCSQRCCRQHNDHPQAPSGDLQGLGGIVGLCFRFTVTQRCPEGMKLCSCHAQSPGEKLSPPLMFSANNVIVNLFASRGCCLICH